MAVPKDIKRTRNNTNVVFSEKNRFRIFFIPLITEALFVIAFQFLKIKTTKKRELSYQFNVLIGETAVTKNLTLATKNISDFARFDVIKIEAASHFEPNSKIRSFTMNVRSSEVETLLKLLNF